MGRRIPSSEPSDNRGVHSLKSVLLTASIFVISLAVIFAVLYVTTTRGKAGSGENRLPPVEGGIGKDNSRSTNGKGRCFCNTCLTKWSNELQNPNVTVDELVEKCEVVGSTSNSHWKTQIALEQGTTKTKITLERSTRRSRFQTHEEWVGIFNGVRLAQQELMQPRGTATVINNIGNTSQQLPPNEEAMEADDTPPGGVDDAMEAETHVPSPVHVTAPVQTIPDFYAVLDNLGKFIRRVFRRE